MKLDTDKLVKADKLLEALFELTERPTLRTIRRWQYERKIPYYKIGNNVFFDPAQVREALNKKNLVRSV